MRLPALNQQNKWLAFAVGYVGFCVLYVWTGRVHLGHPTQLAASAVDNRIPFLSWTVWIYHSQFFFLAFSVWAVKQAKIISRSLYAMAAASLISFAAFFVYPTTLPRIDMAAAALTRQAFTLLYSIDPPTNCFPSLHVALAWLAALGIGAEYRRGRWLAWLWAALISVSTLTTKQHYFIDVAGGLCVAALCWLLAKRFSLAAATAGQSAEELAQN